MWGDELLVVVEAPPTRNPLLVGDGALVHLLLLQRNDYSVLTVESLLESSKMLKLITSAVQFSDMLKTSTELHDDYS